MTIKMKAILMAMAFCCVFGSTNSFAGQELDAVNAQVEQQSAAIDQKYGVLLDYQERNDLKLDLITVQVLNDSARDETTSVKDMADSAFVTYEITDPAEQRKLLIKIQSKFVIQEGTGTSGNEPNYP